MPTPEELAAQMAEAKAQEAAAQAKAKAEAEAKAKEDEDVFDAEKAKALIAKLRGEEKEGKKAKARLAEFEAEEQKRQDAAKSELQKEQERAAKLEAENKTLKADQMRAAAAEKVKLPAAFASRLQGETPEELEADAKKLLEAMPVKQAPSGNPTNPGGPQLQTGETIADRRKRLGLA